MVEISTATTKSCVEEIFTILKMINDEKFEGRYYIY